jgi:hypothetical protein
LYFALKLNLLFGKVLLDKMNLNPNQLSDYANTFVTVLVDYSQKIISAFVILFIGLTPFGLSIDLSGN